MRSTTRRRQCGSPSTSVWKYGSALGIAALSWACGSIPEPETVADPEPVSWVLKDFLETPPVGLSMSSEPTLTDSPAGPAVLFDGEDDAFFLDGNPLQGLRTFTIEVVFLPASDGPPEQRFLHFGFADGDRALLETRVTEEGRWYLDSFVQKGDANKALIDPELLHPADRWYHLAYVVDDGRLKNYVDGKLELSAEIPFTPLEGGRTSIGVRLNRVFWFKGAIHSIRITPEALESESFTRPVL